MAPVLHRYVVPPEAVIDAEAPIQILPSLLVLPDVSATVVTIVGSGFTVMVRVVLAEQLFAFVTVIV